MWSRGACWDRSISCTPVLTQVVHLMTYGMECEWIWKVFGRCCFIEICFHAASPLHVWKPTFPSGCQHFLLVLDIHVATITSTGFRLRILLANGPPTPLQAGGSSRSTLVPDKCQNMRILALDSWTRNKHVMKLGYSTKKHQSFQ